MADILDQPRESFAAYYDRPLYDALFRWIDLRKIAVIREALARLPEAALVLDLGCGSGRVLARSRKPGSTAIAGDIDLSLLQRARARGATPLCIDFDADLPIQDSTLDGALIIDAIEHTESPHTVLGKLHRALKPGGVLVVFTPPYDSHAWIAAEKAHNLLTRRRSDHISPFTRESLSFAVGRLFPEFRVGRVNLGLSMYAVAVKGR